MIYLVILIYFQSCFLWMDLSDISLYYIAINLVVDCTMLFYIFILKKNELLLTQTLCYVIERGRTKGIFGK